MVWGTSFFLSNCWHIVSYGLQVVFLRVESAVATGRRCRCYGPKVPLVRGEGAVGAGCK